MIIERALTCPQCTGPLPAGRFTRSTVCPFCGSTVLLGDERVVPAARFRDAFEQWNAPDRHGYAEWLALGDRHWALGEWIARGEVSDVYFGQRARWPTERVLVKILRDGDGSVRFEQEWHALSALRRSRSPGAATLRERLPRPVDRGTVTAGLHAGSQVMILVWQDGFHHTFEAVRRAHPGGIEPRAAIWVWRRILEVLSFIHASGMVHGAVLPPHLLVEDGEHGVLLVGYGRAAAPGSQRPPAVPGFEAFHPDAGRRFPSLSPALDVAMSARTMAFLLGGDPDGGGLPEAVPDGLAAAVRTACAARRSAPDDLDAWGLRERLGSLARDTFGPPAFCPISMPHRPAPAVGTI